MAGHVLLTASQLTWQPHELLHVTLPHDESVPMHVAVHLSPPHVMVPHAALPCREIDTEGSREYPP